jgi:hypothetical protein
MKKMLLLMTCIFTLSYCSKNEDIKRDLNDAKITEFNNFPGSCAHGWIIETANLTFRAETIPNENELKEIVTQNDFPILVRLEFKPFEGLSVCSDIYRTVTYWELKK